MCMRVISRSEIGQGGGTQKVHVMSARFTNQREITTFADLMTK